MIFTLGEQGGWGDARLVKFSAAVAAIVCTRTPGALNAPGYDETLAFMGLRQR